MTIDNFNQNGSESKNDVRKTVPVTEHWFVYLDDPYKLLYENRKGITTWIRFCSAKDASETFTPDEEARLINMRKFLKNDTPTLEDARGIIGIVPEIRQYLNPKDVEELDTDGDLTETRPASFNPPAMSKGSNMPQKSASTSGEFTVQKGSELVIAQKLGLDPELADAFFMKLNGNFYIRVAGLQYMAGKIGYNNIEVTDHYDEKTKTWVAEAKIYPKVTPKIIEAIAKLEPELQRDAFEALRSPTNGKGSANYESVQNSKVRPFLREMAQTRAIGRALRAYTGYGATSYEEMADAKLDKE